MVLTCLPHLCTQANWQGIWHKEDTCAGLTPQIRVCTEPQNVTLFGVRVLAGAVSEGEAIADQGRSDDRCARKRPCEHTRRLRGKTRMTEAEIGLM